MNNIIQLIEKIGQSSDLTADNYNTIVNQSEVSDELKKALIDQDMISLEKLLGASHNLMSLVIPADDDEESDDSEEEKHESIAV